LQIILPPLRTTKKNNIEDPDPSGINCEGHRGHGESKKQKGKRKRNRGTADFAENADSYSPQRKDQEPTELDTDFTD
jgi:hypothetical protein